MVQLGVGRERRFICRIGREASAPGLPESPPEFLAVASFIAELEILVPQVGVLVLEFAGGLLQLEDDCLEIRDCNGQQTNETGSTAD